MTNPFRQRAMVMVGMLSLGAALYASQATPGAPAGMGITGNSPKVTPAPNSASSAVWAQIKSLEQTYKANLASIDQQIALLRQQIQAAESSLKPLLAQREALVAPFEDQRASLMDQVEPGYLAAFQQEQQGLSAAKSQHDQAIAAANQQFASQRQQIQAQFQTTIKGLKKA